MKYIRTIYNNEVYEVENEYTDLQGKHWYVALNGQVEVEDKEIIKQADTIEELCDEFVLFGNHIIPTHSCYYDLSDIVVEKCLLDEVNVYGAIWTDKGLKYVAKMNDKGELELL